MILRELPAPALTRRLRQDGLRLRTGPFLFELRSPLPLVQEGIARLYADYPLGADDEYVDYALRIEHGAGWRRWVKPQARFLFDDQQVFEPMPASHAMERTISEQKDAVLATLKTAIQNSIDRLSS